MFVKKKDKDTFSLKHNLSQLKDYEDILTKKQIKIIKDSIKKRLGLKINDEVDYDSIFEMRSLYNEVFNLLYKRISIFSVKYYLKLIKRLLQERKTPNVFMNFNKQRFLAYNSLLNSLEKGKKINETYFEKAEFLIKKICHDFNQENSLDRRFLWCTKKLEDIW